MSEREPFAQYLERMAARGFRPSRRFGQNFLLDPTLHRAIVAALAPAPQDLVLEIGAGLGFLTRELARAAGAVVAVEIDPRLAAILREEIAGFAAPQRVELVVADVLGAGDELEPAVGAALARQRLPGRFLICANLPYAISGPLLGRLPLQPRVAELAVLLVQLDFAERLLAHAGKAVSALSLLLQLGYGIELLRKVGRDVFRPRPQVDSAIVRLRRLADSPLWTLPVAARRDFAAFLRASFAARRKQLGSNWARWEEQTGRRLPAAAAECAVLRPDQVSAERYLELWRGCASLRPG